MVEFGPRFVVKLMLKLLGLAFHAGFLSQEWGKLTLLSKCG